MKDKITVHYSRMESVAEAVELARKECQEAFGAEDGYGFTFAATVVPSFLRDLNSGNASRDVGKFDVTITGKRAKA